MSSVTVLCPNARRQQVKVIPNMKVLQIIDEVCKKQGLNSDEFDLIFQRRKLDVTLAFRLTGVPANAQLELKKLDEPRRASDVIIALQLEDGSRLPQQSFNPGTNLADLLNAFKSAPESLLSALDASIPDLSKHQPICSYLNDEIIGEFQLKHTQLKELGLTGGRAIIRFSYRAVDEEKLEKSNSEFRSKLQKKLELEEKFKQAQQEQQQSSTIHIVEEKEEEKPAPPVPVLVQHQAIAPIVPEVKKQKVLNSQSMDIDESQSAAFSDRPIQNNEFANFKFPESTKGMVLNDVNELAEIEALSKKACAREELIYSIEEKPDTHHDGEDLPDDFYEHTVNDLRLMLDDLERKKNTDQPLMTKAMRELENDKKAMRYEKIVVRVKFQNKFILQGLFRPKELVQALYSFVEASIEQTSETLDFYLYTTPPKVVLNDKKKTLFDANLCPASIVHFGTKTSHGEFTLTQSHLVSYSNLPLKVPNFTPNLTANIKRVEEADEIAKTNVHQRIRNIEHEGIEWLQKENELARNILKSSGLMNNANRGATTSAAAATNNYPTTSRTGTTQDAKRDKLERFLKGTKK